MALNQPINTETSGYSRSYRRLMARNPGYVIVQAALAILRRYGQDAHIYLPGVGMLNGLQASNYLDSAGTTVGTVDQPVGLVLDAAGGLGVELVTNGDFATNDLTNWSSFGCVLAVVGGKLVVTSVISSGGALHAIRTFSTVAGKTYTVNAEFVGRDAPFAVGIAARATDIANTPIAISQSILSPGLMTVTFVATGTTSKVNIRVDGSNFTTANTATFDNISVREVTGIAASQPTTASKPILRRGAVNLLTYSGDFSNAAWTKSNVTLTPGIADPFGGMTATTLTATGVAGIFNQASGTMTGVSCAWMRRRTGSGVIRLRSLNAGGGVEQPVTSEWQLFFYPTSVTGAYGAVIDIITPGDAIDVYRCGVFSSVLTAAQIQALGGIPLTLTAPASTALGPHYWSFDGSNDSLSLGAPLFQMSDDHWVVVVAKVSTSSASVAALAWPSAGSATVRYCGLQIIPNTGAVGVVWFDGTNADTIYHPTPQPISDAFVLSGRKLGNSGVARLNGVTFGTRATLTADGVATLGAIGARPSGGVNENLNGNIYLAASGKGAITEAELLLIEKMLGQIAGVQI